MSLVAWGRRGGVFRVERMGASNIYFLLSHVVRVFYIAMVLNRYSKRYAGQARASPRTPHVLLRLRAWACGWRSKSRLHLWPDRGKGRKFFLGSVLDRRTRRRRRRAGCGVVGESKCKTKCEAWARRWGFCIFFSEYRLLRLEANVRLFANKISNLAVKSILSHLQYRARGTPPPKHAG